MKKSTLIFLLFVFFLALKLFKVFLISEGFLILMFVFWALVFYFEARSDNKRRNTPMPVYIASPQD